jgi:hypothetical protein
MFSRKGGTMGRQITISITEELFQKIDAVRKEWQLKREEKISFAYVLRRLVVERVNEILTEKEA